MLRRKSLPRVVSNLLIHRPMASARPFSRLCCALLFALAATPGRALQLGENEAQITARHGAPAVEDHGRHLAVYFWEGWSAQLEFQDGVVAKLSYRRNGYLTDEEIQSLLQANGGLAQWAEWAPRRAQSRHWSRADGATAECDAERATSMLFQGGGQLAPSAPGLESSLEFAPPEKPMIVAVTAERAPTWVPSATPVPQKTVVKARLPEIERPRISSGERPIPAPESPLGSTPAMKPAAPPVPTGGLMILLALALGAVGFVRKITARRPSRRSRQQAAPAVPAQPPPVPSHPPATPALSSLEWDQFELLVGEIFRRQGYVIELSAALGADGGIDLMLRRDGENIPVQCKHWKTARVAAREMREFYGTMMDAAAPRGIFVTTGGFSRDAREFAEGKPIELIDGPALERHIAAVRRPAENIFDVTGWIGDFAAAARIFDPECPRCRGAMTVRHNRSSGAAFWGCTTYPRCTGKRDPRRDLLAAVAAA